MTDSTVENWLPIDGHDGYEVSDLGRARCWRRRGNAGGRETTPRMLKAYPLNNGYLQIGILVDGRVQKLSLHCVVLTAFRGTCPPGQEGCHENGVRSDCKLSNLRWDTRKGNHADKRRHGTLARGERHGNATMSDELAKKVRDEPGSAAAAARKFKVGYAAAWNVRNGRGWSHLESSKGAQSNG